MNTMTVEIITLQNQNRALREALGGMLRWFGDYPIGVHPDNSQACLLSVEQAKAAMVPG